MTDPFLVFSTCQEFDAINVVTDKGSKATLGVSFWKPLPSTGWFYLGMYATPNYENPPSPPGPIRVFQASRVPAAGELAALAPPTQFFVQTWTCIGDDQSSNLGIYGFEAPPGYVALGSVAVPDFHTPPTTADFPGLMCVRQDLCSTIQVGASNLIWTDKGSRAPTDVSVWLLPQALTCVAMADESGYPESYTVIDVTPPAKSPQA